MKLGIEVGGTFTDLILVGADGHVRKAWRGVDEGTEVCGREL